MSTPANKYIGVDCTETSTGTTVSLEMSPADAAASGSFTRDVTFDGIVQFASGSTFPLQQLIAKDYANVLSWQSAPDKSGVWNIVADGDPQPLEKPHEITYQERTIAGTSVVRLSGQIFDPASGKRINFTITHDPVEVAVAIVAGIAALICGAIVLVEAVTKHCTEQAQTQCGVQGVKKITLVRKYGFSWKKGSPDVGCGEECKIECNP